MEQTVDKSNFGYLGVDFQYMLVKAFMEEPKFFAGIKPIVNSNAFTEPLLRRFVGIIVDWYDEWDNVPSYQSVETELRRKAKSNIDIEEAVAIIDKIKSTSTSGIEVAKDLAQKFFLQQSWLRISNEIRDIVANGGIDCYEKCKAKIDEITLVGNEDEYGHNLYELKDKALANDYTVSIGTGIGPLDEVLGGGLDKGKLGLIIAPAGFGKTSFTTGLCHFAATHKTEANNYEGFKVLQIYFEDDDVDIARKHFGRELQQEARTFRHLLDDQRAIINEALENHPDKELLSKNLRLKHFKTGSKSASDIESFIKKLINSGFKPDLVSIDYFECLAPEKGGHQSDSEWTREGITMRKLEALAHELDIAIWLPTQGTKDSINSPDMVRMDQAGGSIKKIHVAQVILSIARSVDDQANNRAVIAVLKNRAGKSGAVFNNILFNNGTSTFEISDMETYDNTKMYTEVAEVREQNNYNNIARQMRSQIDAREMATAGSGDFPNNVDF